MLEEVRERANELYKKEKDQEKKNKLSWAIGMLQDNMAFSKMTSSVAFSILGLLGYEKSEIPKFYMKLVLAKN